ncbi:MAG: hypothetical protein L0211_04305 [Planctomycetaceae bacterium]|nr:hypothetical protein [Planctomycetaceae bacterium]
MLIALTGAALGQERPVSEIPAILTVKPLEIADSDSELRRLLKERYNEATAQVKDLYELYRRGRAPINDISYAIEAFADAAGELAETPAAKVSELELARDVAKAVEVITKRKFDAGQEPRIALQHARICRLGLDIRLVHAREAAKAAREAK